MSEIPLEVVLAAIRECVIVVKPGETLVIRIDPGRKDLIQNLGCKLRIDEDFYGFKWLVLGADELGVIESE